MQTEIKFSPSFAVATITLSASEQIKAEAGAMVSMQGVDIETSTQGGIMKGLKRSVLGGESFFMNTFTAGHQGGQVSFAPELPGDIVAWELTGQTVYLQSGAYLASAMSVDVDSGWGGAKTFFSSEGLFILKCSGHGQLVVSAYGAIEGRQLAAGESFTIDSGHVVGWSDGITYKVRKVGNWKSTFLSGEGLVADLTGPGTVYMQTRSPEALVSWLIPKLPKSSN
ncbi:MAG: TIGR00266 family protein [Candidatus Nanopelagicales bacterium]